MKEFMPKKNQNKKSVENILVISSLAKKAKEKDASVINATAGSYYDESGNLKVFDCVKRVFDNPNYNTILSYSNSKGTLGFMNGVEKWILGEDYKEEYSNYYFKTIATPGGTGALSLSLGTYLESGEGVMLPDIMWLTYLQIANNLGINAHTYKLFDENNHLNLESIYSEGLNLQEKYGKVCLLINDPCHNPTGYSMSENDYLGLIEVLNKLSLNSKVILILDIAYLDYSNNQGKKTREHFRLLKKLSSNVMVLFAFSASKTFGIYGLRLGALMQMTKDEKESQLFENASAYFARSTWSNTSHLGMEIVESTLNNASLKEKFVVELKKTCEDLEKRAYLLIDELKKYNVPFAPYHNGFFVLLLVNNPAFEKELEEAGVYGCHFGNGYRIAVASISQEEAVRLGEIVGKIYQNY